MTSTNEAEQLVTNLTHRHRELEERRTEITRHRDLLASDTGTPIEVRTVMLQAQDNKYAGVVSELADVATELYGASRRLLELQGAERVDAEKKAAEKRAADLDRRAVLVEEATDWAAQCDELAKAFVATYRKLDASIRAVCAIDKGDVFTSQRRLAECFYCAMVAMPVKVCERPSDYARKFADYVDGVAGRKKARIVGKADPLARGTRR